LVAAILGLAVIVLSARPTLATSVALTAAMTFSLAASAGAVAFDNGNSTSVRAAFLPGERSWVDRAGFDEVTLVRAPDGVRTEALEQLFWNPSVDRVVLLPGAEEVDHFRSSSLTLGNDGSLRSEGRPLAGPVLVDGYGGTIVLAEADQIASSQSFTLWRPHGAARMSLYMAGRYSDGWLAGNGRLYLWPERTGESIERRVTLTLTAPPGAEGMTIRLQEPGRRPLEVPLVPGRPETVAFDVCSRGSWQMTYSSTMRGFVGSRVVSARSTEPRISPISCSRDPLQVQALRGDTA